MDHPSARGAQQLSEGPSASDELEPVESCEPDWEQSLRDTFATVEVVSALTGTAICSVHAKSVLELKACIEEATGINSLDQLLLLDSKTLPDEYPIMQEAVRIPWVVGLLRRPPVVSAVVRAIDELDADDMIEIPDRVNTLDKELTDLHVQGSDMEQLASLLVDRVLLEPTLSQICAAVAGTLVRRYAEKFSREFLNSGQAEFEGCPRSPDGIDAAEYEKAKTKMLALATFIGYLFVWDALPMRVLAGVVEDLLMGADEGEWSPQEHLFECACELLVVAGWDLDHTPKGRALVTHGVKVLSDLIACSDPNSGEPVYSERLTESVQKLIEVRSNNSPWPRICRLPLTRRASSNPPAALEANII